MTHVSHEVLSLCRTELGLQGGISRATQEKIGSEACGPADVVAHCYFQFVHAKWNETKILFHPKHAKLPRYQHSEQRM